MKNATKDMPMLVEQEEPRPDIGERSRFRTASFVSLAVNALFLIGAGVLITPPPDGTGSERTLYITLIHTAAEGTMPRQAPLPTVQPSHSITKPLPIPSLAPTAPEHSEPRHSSPPVASVRPATQSIAPKPHLLATLPVVTPTPRVLPVLSGKPGDMPSPQALASSEEITTGMPAGKGETDNISDGTGTASAPAVSEATPEPASSPSVPASSPSSPKPSGMTRDAETVNQVLPEIPDYLKEPNTKMFVRVKIAIEADGSFVPTLSTSSGNPQIDFLVLTALKRWRWRSALKDGQPVASTQSFRFEFEVQ